MTPFLFLLYGLAAAVILGAIGAAALIVVAVWLWLIAPPRRS